MNFKDKTEDFSVLFPRQHQMAVYSRTCPSLWWSLEGAVKSMKTHLRRVVGEYKLTFEELYTAMTQVEACLNSRPLAPLPHADECLEALTPGHFIIGQPLEALPDPSESYLSILLLKQWHLVQLLVRHFWQRWSTEYLTTLSRVGVNLHPNFVLVI